MPSIAFMSSGVSSKSNTWKENRIIFTSLPRRQPPPGDWRTFQLDGDKKRGQGSCVCPLLPGEQAWDPLLSSHLSFPHLLLCLPHKHYSASVPYLSKWITSDRKEMYSFVLGHSCLNTCTWTNIRLLHAPQHALSVTALHWSHVGRSLPCKSLSKNLISNLLFIYE